ncbi:uncharacterized protein RAG0_07446 [Rhynchosporium agropyri]|uniref:Uncharacterized protein n=1 Tax=Rhynchosporium agropyri TaxID=914238 RepID=A0A1E1KLG6_9HELO|nr:uncharacterized protein RAG0_07446 [Rhynchosporium agropyri]
MSDFQQRMAKKEIAEAIASFRERWRREQRADIQISSSTEGQVQAPGGYTQASRIAATGLRPKLHGENISAPRRASAPTNASPGPRPKTQAHGKITPAPRNVTTIPRPKSPAPIIAPTGPRLKPQAPGENTPAPKNVQLPVNVPTESRWQGSPCPNCEGPHKLKICPGPPDEHGYVKGCGRCNTQDHNLPECRMPRSASRYHSWKSLIIKSRDGRPPMICKRDLLDPSFRECLEPYRPWTRKFACEYTARPEVTWAYVKINDPTWQLEDFDIERLGPQIHPSMELQEGNFRYNSKLSDQPASNNNSQDQILSMQSGEIHESPSPLAAYQTMHPGMGPAPSIPDIQIPLPNHETEAHPLPRRVNRTTRRRLNRAQRDAGEKKNEIALREARQGVKNTISGSHASEVPISHHQSQTSSPHRRSPYISRREYDMDYGEIPKTPQYSPYEYNADSEELPKSPHYHSREYDVGHAESSGTSNRTPKRRTVRSRSLSRDSRLRHPPRSYRDRTPTPDRHLPDIHQPRIPNEDQPDLSRCRSADLELSEMVVQTQPPDEDSSDFDQSLSPASLD